MTYSESAVDMTITRSRAIIELQKHGVTDTAEFFNDMGDRAEYDAMAVLEWLGY